MSLVQPWTFGVSQPSSSNFVARAIRSQRRKLQNGDRAEARQVGTFIHRDTTFLTVQHSKDAPTNPRGIPVAPFVDRVEDYVTDRSEVESTINSFKEMISCVPGNLYNREHGNLFCSENTNSWSRTHNAEL